MFPTEVTKWSPSHGYLQRSLVEPKMLENIRQILAVDASGVFQVPMDACTGRSQELALLRGHQRLPLLSCTGRSQELALTERAPALPPLHQGACGVGCSPELVPTLGRLLVICLAQQVAQWAAHVVPLLPHSWQKTFVFMCQSFSLISAHV